MSELRKLPSMDVLLNRAEIAGLESAYSHETTLAAARHVLDEIRQRARSGEIEEIPSVDSIQKLIQEQLVTWFSPSLVPVINATGVILHTNLGRAPLSRSAALALVEASSSYSNLEFDLTRGARGKREEHLRGQLKLLTGAEDALVVNNNAGAILLVLSALARHKNVLIARSQLIEIGGGFRIPDVMRQSGARLVEVGTTNRVRIEDFTEALDDQVALVMRAHHSNFKIVGFAEEPTLAELVMAAHASGAPVLDDLGSGALLDTTQYGLAHEPTVQESLAAGADVVCFSGDKLLGGPQAGIIVGKTVLLEKVRRHPLARALRADKLCLAALTATLTHYLKHEAEREIPVWRMISTPVEKLFERVTRWRDALQRGEIIHGLSTVGGGSLPEETLPTHLLALSVCQPNKFLAQLRALHPAIIARIDQERICLDPRTVLPEQENDLLRGLGQVLG